MPKEDDPQEQGGKKDLPKPETKPGHYPPQKVKHEEDGKADKSK